MNAGKTYADFGIPAPAPCPSWCPGSHVIDDAGPGRAVIFHGASGIGGGVLAGGEVVTVGMNWTERFEDGAWKPFRAENAVVFLQVAMDYIAVDATDRNMAGLATVARLISRQLVPARSRATLPALHHSANSHRRAPLHVHSFLHAVESLMEQPPAAFRGRLTGR